MFLCLFLSIAVVVVGQDLVQLISPKNGAIIDEIATVVFKASSPVNEYLLNFDGTQYTIAPLIQCTTAVNDVSLCTFTLHGIGYGSHSMSIVRSTIVQSDTIIISRPSWQPRIKEAYYGNPASSYSFQVSIATFLAAGESEMPLLVSHETFNLTPPGPDIDDLHLTLLYDSGIVHRYRHSSQVPVSDILYGWHGRPYPSVPSNQFRHHLGLLLDSKVGLEVGGPSPSQEDTGIYVYPARMDNVNFAKQTLWNMEVGSSGDYVFSGKRSPGRLFYADVVDLKGVRPSDGSELYDFIFASHMLEHTVNPLLAVEQMAGLLKPGTGHIILVLPWKEVTFDHLRPDTPFLQLLEHYHTRRNESHVADLLPDIVRQYNLTRDPGAGTEEQFVARSLRQGENKALHVHVFGFELIGQCLEFFHFEVIDVELFDMHQMVVARRIA